MFTQTNTCGTKLAAGKNCTVTVTFTPSFAGTFTGTLTFTDADVTSPQVVTLTGTGTAALTSRKMPAMSSAASSPRSSTSLPTTSEVMTPG